MPEIRFNVKKKLDKLVREIADSVGVDKSDYAKSLILNDLRGKKKI